MKTLKLKLAAALLLALSLSAGLWAADLTITAASCVPATTGAQFDISHVAGEAITAGQPVYVKAADSKLYKADANASSATAAAVGIAVCNAAAGQPCAFQKGGDLTIGGTMTKGAIYYVSETAGGICPEADLMAGDYVTQLGYAKSTTVLTVRVNATGVQK
jgi:hypothetical protein